MYHACLDCFAPHLEVIEHNQEIIPHQLRITPGKQVEALGKIYKRAYTNHLLADESIVDKKSHLEKTGIAKGFYTKDALKIFIQLQSPQ